MKALRHFSTSAIRNGLVLVPWMTIACGQSGSNSRDNADAGTNEPAGASGGRYGANSTDASSLGSFKGSGRDTGAADASGGRSVAPTTSDAGSKAYSGTSSGVTGSPAGGKPASTTSSTWAGSATGGKSASTASSSGASAGGTASPTGGTNPARKKVLDYFARVTEKGTVAGQHNKHNYDPSGSTNWVRDNTGKQPGLWSGDFLFGQSEVSARPQMITEAIRQWQAGSIVQVMYHSCIPTRDELCEWDDVGGANPQHLSDAQWNELVTSGTTLNLAWLARLDTLSVFFRQLKDAGVAPLFRPLHEMNQSVFWWGGRGGENGTRRLFQLTHDYLTKTKGFDNIVWVWDVQDFASLAADVSSYDPGPDYFDIAALDVYDGNYTKAKYDAMSGASHGKPIAIGECQHPPSSNVLAEQPHWAFFMLWPDFLDENAEVLPGLYAASNVITQDEMLGWK